MHRDIPPAPRLPDADTTYSAAYMARLLHVLHAYFARISGALSGLFGPHGGAGIESPHAGFANTTAQATSPVSFSLVSAARGIRLQTNTQIVADYPGMYALSVYLQGANTNAGVAQFDMWVDRLGVPVPATAVRYTLPARVSPTEPSHTPIVATWLMSVTTPNAEFFSIAWQSNMAGVSLHAPSGTVSSRITIQFVSALP